MKKILLKSVMLALIGAVALACFTVKTNAAMNVQAFFSPGVPTDSTNNLSNQQNKMAWLETGNVVGGSYDTNPVAFNLPAVLKIGDLLRFRSGFPGWLARATSSGPDVFGARMFCLVKITSDTENVNPRRVRVRTWTLFNDGVLWTTNWIASESITMSSTLTGRKYGPDGIRGGADDQVFNSGSSDVSLSELTTVGPRIFLDVFNQGDLNLALNYWDGKRPMELHCEVVVFDADMLTVLGRTEVVLSARPHLWYDRGSNSNIQYVRMESEREKDYQLLGSSSLRSWSPVSGAVLRNGGVYTNNAALNPTNYLFFQAREIALSALGSATSDSTKAIPTGTESGNEVP